MVIYEGYEGCVMNEYVMIMMFGYQRSYKVRPIKTFQQVFLLDASLIYSVVV